MLRRLYVRNYVLIDSLDIEFPEGLVIITGQTGAGKSILLGSISLVLGAKTDASVIGEAAENCVVEAEFDVPSDDSAILQILSDNDIENTDDRLVVRRVVSSSGRSRAFVNDSPVPAAVLAALSSRLIDIHSQHQTLLLSDRHFHLSALDHYAGNASRLKICSEYYSRYVSTKSQLYDVNTRISELEGERDYSRARYSMLESANLQEGELEGLEAEQKQLANAEEIKDSLYAVEMLFSADDADGRLSLDAVLRESIRRMEKIIQFVPEAAAITDRLSSARVELDDILSEITGINTGIEVSQDRLAYVEERMSLLYGLMQKFSCRDVAGLIAEREALKASLYDSTALEERRRVLEKELGLHALRKEARQGGLGPAGELLVPPDGCGVRAEEVDRVVVEAVLGDPYRREHILPALSLDADEEAYSFEVPPHLLWRDILPDSLPPGGAQLAREALDARPEVDAARKAGSEVGQPVPVHPVGLEPEIVDALFLHDRCDEVHSPPIQLHGTARVDDVQHAEVPADELKDGPVHLIWVA